MADKALSGVRVLDLTQFEAGTFCTQVLGWLGANVIKIEPPKGDQGRQPRPWEPKGTDAIYFQIFNCNKRSIIIDLKNPEGHALFLRLVPQGDVVVENWAPGVAEKLGIGYPVLKELNPRVIMARIKGFGLTGPYSEYKCFEMIAQAAGAGMSTNGYPDQGPLRVGVGVGDSGTGVHTALSIIAALFQRERSGRGQLVEGSMQETVANLMRANYVDHYRTGTCTPRQGNDRAGQVPCGIFPCAPGGPNDYVYIAVNWRIEQMWVDLATAMGREDMLSDPRFGSMKLRGENRKEVDEAVAAWTSQRTKAEAMRILAGAGIPCSATLSTADLLDDPHLNERGMIATVNHPVRGPFRIPSSPFHLSDSPAELTPSPLLGQHTDEILKEVLGLGQAEIAELRASKAIG